MPAALAFLLRSVILFLFTPYNFLGAPNSMKILSTLSTRSLAFSLSLIISTRSPPISGLKFNVPSENVPEPPTPHIILHGSQLIHLPFLTMGHFLLFMSLPLSTIRISNDLSTSSYAANIPAGPAPTIITSYLSFIL